MSIRRTAVVAVVALTGALVAVTAPAASAATCTPTYLPLPAGLPNGAVTAADSGGGYAGYAYVVTRGLSMIIKAVRWSDGQVTDLGQLGTSNVTVTGVNRQGTVVGYVAGPRGFRSRDGKLEQLPTPSGYTGALVEGVNDNGDIVGSAVSTPPDTAPYSIYTPVLWPASGSAPVALTGLPTTGYAKAKAVDQDGTVLVEHYPARNSSSATALYLWKAGTARKLANPSDTTTVRGWSLSNGRVAGETYPASGYDGKGVLWDQNGVPSRPAGSAYLRSINRSGQSVGWSTATGTYATWQLATRAATLTDRPSVDVSADNGTVAGRSVPSAGANSLPTVWRCG
ncbi:hypothetical protein AB0G02_15910 [Actinosynnema sp. NPDC023658]|uniref:hypothetical protein n=1 Tax=Actinosynnema sp. NPDC023658 TaxID=3155465 RepID=UPI003405FAB7